MRDTVPARPLATETASSPTATSTGPSPTAIAFDRHRVPTTRQLDSPDRVVVELVTHTVPTDGERRGPSPTTNCRIPSPRDAASIRASRSRRCRRARPSRAQSDIREVRDDRARQQADVTARDAAASNPTRSPENRVASEPGGFGADRQEWPLAIDRSIFRRQTLPRRGRRVLGEPDPTLESKSSPLRKPAQPASPTGIRGKPSPRNAESRPVRRRPEHAVGAPIRRSNTRRWGGSRPCGAAQGRHA